MGIRKENTYYQMTRYFRSPNRRQFFFNIVLQAEQNRLDTQHASFRMILDGWLALAPFTSPPAFVLDIGTGTGIWATEFGES